MPTPDLCKEFAQHILDRHDQPGVSEEDIRAAVRDFLIETKLADRGEIDMEQSPAKGWSGRVDLRTSDLIIEFKVRIGDRLTPDSEHVEQLDRYLNAALEGGRPQRYGLLTDGKYWILRWPGMGDVRTGSQYAFTLETAEHGLNLFEWLRDRSQMLEARGMAPTEDQIHDRLGAGFRFERHLDGLRALYQPHREEPTISVKRELWRQLLAAALGEVVDQDENLDELFLRHTYLSAVVGLAVQAAFGIEIDSLAADQPDRLLNGQTFVDKTGLSGVVESDFFTWPIEVDGGSDWLRGLAGRVARFDWTQSQSDIARILYEAVIPTDQRKRLGEYYTPDWLAKMIVDEVVTDPLSQRVLDPACGSGTFIFAAVRKHLEAAREAGIDAGKTLDGLLSHVIGIDVHPVAVHLARTTWTFAARDALHAARDADARVNVSVPIYLGDSLQLRTNPGDIFEHNTVRVQIDDDLSLQFPRSLVEQGDWFDSVVSKMGSYIEQSMDPVLVLQDEKMEGSDLEMLTETARTLEHLHAEGRNHIWAYYTRNLVRPVALRNDPVDVIVGNPPWITYNSTEAVIREELESQSKSRYAIWVGGRHAPNQDVAGLFYARCVDLYLRPGGRAAMVVPYSALEAGQYRKWRSGEWGDVLVDLDHASPWDLEQIRPNTFFPMPACVVFLRRRDSNATRLGSYADVLLGAPGGPFEHERRLLVDNSAPFRSPYGEHAKRGADVFPRMLYFVVPQENGAIIKAESVVEITARRSNKEKKPWKLLETPKELSDATIEREHVFDVHLGETIAPYVLLEPLQAVIPISRHTGELEKSEGGWYGLDRKGLGDRMRRRWEAVNKLWDEHKGATNEKSLVERLDYQLGLSAQRGRGVAGSRGRGVAGSRGRGVAGSRARYISHQSVIRSCRPANCSDSARCGSDRRYKIVLDSRR